MTVMYILRDWRIKDPEILAAAVLHDTVEDTDTTLDDIEANFGANIRKYVEEVTDDKSLNKAERKRLQIEHVATMSLGAKLIKLADKFHNLSSLTLSVPEGWSSKRVKGYFAWAVTIIRSILLSIQDDHYYGVISDEFADFEYSASFNIDGEWHVCVQREHLDEILEEYLHDMATIDE